MIFADSTHYTSRGEELMKILSLSVLLLIVLLTLPTAAFRVVQVAGLNLTALIADRIGEPMDIDPAWAYDTASGELLMNVYDTLLTFNRTDMTTYIPRLATSWSFQTIDEMSPEGLHWVSRLTFTIRTGVHFQYYDGSIPGEGGLLTPADVEYTFERLLVTDAGTGPSWMLWKPLFGNYSAWYLNAALADLGWPTNPTTGWNTKCDEAIDYAIESDATHVWFNLINVTLNSAGSQYFVPCEALLQVLSQSLGGILNQAWCVWHGDWPGMQVGDDWYMWHDPATSPLYTLPKGDTSSPGPHLNAALGTGPYMLDYWNRGAGNAWSIIKNPNYWEGWTVPFAHEGWAGYTIDGHVDRYTSYYIPEWSARKVRFLAGLSDFCDVPRYNISEVLGQPGILCVYPLPQLTCYACSFNFLVSDSSTYLGVMQPNSTFNQYGAPPNIMEDLNFRRALAHLFNYTNYLETAFLNEAVSPVTPIIPEISYYNSSIGQLENPVLDQRKKYGINGEPAGQLAYDSAFAVTYLQAAWGGQLWANGFTFDAVYNEGNLARQTAALLLKSAFDQINAQYGTKFTIKVTSIPWNSYRILQRTRFMPYCISSWFADFPDAHDFAYPFMHSLGFFSYLQGFKGVTGFPNQAFDDHVNAGFVTDSPVQRQGNYSWLQQNYVDFCPGFVTSQATSRHFERDWVRGWYYNPFYSGNYVYDLWMEFTGPDFRDVGIYAVRVSPNLVYLGNNNVTVCVDVGDSGCFPETFNVTAYADPNSTVNGDEITIGTQSLSLTDRSFTTLNFTWNTAGVSLGNYTISAYAWPVPGETRTDDNSYSDGVVQIIPVHDVAVTNVIPSQTVVVRGSLLDINVTAANLGDYSEDFNVTVYANGTYVGSQNITLATGSSATLIFTWNTMDVALGNYVLSAYAWPVPGEIHTDDNLYSDGIVRIIPHSPWHDVAVTGVSPSQDVVGQGVPLNINVAVANPGDFVETFNVTVYANSSYIDSRNVTLAVEGSETIIFTWNTTGVSLGNYAMSAYAWPVPGETRTDDNSYSDGVVQIIPVHDVAVTNVIPSQTVVVRGSLLDINVTAANLGDYSEDFNVTVYANGTYVGSQNITLATGSSATLIFTWNTMDVALGNYVLSAYAWPVPGEIHTDDNLYSDGIVRIIPHSPWHDVAVTGVSPSQDVVGQGVPLNINVAVANPGDFVETFNVTVYANSSYIDSRNVTLAVEGSETIIFTWNTTGVSLGNYAMSAYAWPVPGETRTDDNLYSDGVVQIRQLIHDVAITHVVPSLAVVGQGGSVSISVSVQNQGTDAETFNVTVYAGTITVETKQISLANGDSANLAFIWNTGDVAVGEYEVRAEASAVPGEADTADNTLIGGTVTVTIWTPEIYVYPSSCTFDALTSRVGTEFNVTVKVNNVMDMKAWQVKMSFNDSFINVTRWYEPTWDPTYVFYGKTTLPVPNPPQVHYVRGQGYIQGWLSCAAALFPAPDVGGGFTGSGLLCIIAFKITAIPPLNQTLSCVLNVSNFMQTFWIKAGEYSKRPFGDYGNGYYEMTFSGPSFHDVEVYGASVYPNWVYAGENDVTVWVDVWNRGCFPETFSVTVYADLNSTVIGDEITIDTKILSLQTQSFIALTFTWNTTGVPAGNYTISAVASLVPDEADLTNNLRVAGQVGIFVSVPCYDVNVTCPTTVTVNPSIFSYDPAYQARLINIGNVSIVSTGFEGALRVLGSSNGTIRLCVNQPDLDVYNFFLPLNGEVQVPLWLMFQPETHWETYNGDFTLELTVCGTHRRQLHIVGISIIVCQNGAYVVNNETVTFTWTLSGGSLVYLEAEATLPPGWTYSVDPAVGTLFETPHVVTVNITAPPDAKEGDMGYVTLRAYKNATGAMFWQFIYFASTDNKPPTIEAVQSPTLTTAGDLMFSTTVRDGSGISNVQFWYSVNDGSWNNETMQWGLGDTFNSTLYTSTVPHVPDNSVIRYYVIATDWLGNQTQSDVHTFVVKYDLAVTEVKTSKTMVGKGFPTRVDVTVANEGTLASASVKIAVYANKTLIYMQTLQLLAEGTTATLTFDWNTTDISKGNYVIAAFVIPILDETHTENNANASVVAVTIPGDVTGDVWVDMLDISILIEKFMTTPSHPLWDPNCNVNNDNSIDMADISIAIDNFMQT